MRFLIVVATYLACGPAFATPTEVKAFREKGSVVLCTFVHRTLTSQLSDWTDQLNEKIAELPGEVTLSNLTSANVNGADTTGTSLLCATATKK